jgi:hypothetical protein
MTRMLCYVFGHVWRRTQTEKYCTRCGFRLPRY